MPVSFNLAIEILLFSGYRGAWMNRMREALFQSRNRDTSLFRFYREVGKYYQVIKFQSRNRDTSLFRTTIIKGEDASSKSFNLAIEILLLSGLESRRGGGGVASFQSRNRDTSLFK